MAGWTMDGGRHVERLASSVERPSLTAPRSTLEEHSSSIVHGLSSIFKASYRASTTRYPSAPSNPDYDAIAWYATYDHLGRSCTNLLNTLGTGGSPTTLGTSWNGFQP